MRWNSWVMCAVLWCSACGDDDGGKRRVDAGEQDAGFFVCRVDSDCSDGVFCNGIERCMPGPDSPSADGCLPGVAPRCDDGLSCTTDTCSHVANGCRFIPIDADGDGHAALSCETRDGEALGDDCDDTDANRFPGNPETCTAETEDHDEDCDTTTIGVRDVDSDGAIDLTCCNGARCGGDCDDGDRRVGPDYPEVCDGFDNNCDDVTDTDAISVLWYLDADGDGFGRDEENPVVSCAPVTGRSVFNTDLEDSIAAINPAATETCDGLDNDCDGLADEDDVCTCGVPGADPCECVSGDRSCLGDLIPRECVGGFWVTARSCSGITPICLMGRCVCADGGTRCSEVVDRAPPFVLATAPGADVVNVPTTVAVVAVLSESPLASSVNAETFRVFDDNGVAVEGDHTVDGPLVSFVPYAELLAGRVYHVVIEDLADRAGNVMRATSAWRFATEFGDYPREVINAGDNIGFATPTLRTSSTGDVALWVDTGYSCGDCIAAGEELYRRASNATWSSSEWPQFNPFDEVPPTSLSVGAGGLIAALGAQADIPLVRRGANDLAWDVAATEYVAPAAVTVVGDQLVVVGHTANELFNFVEVATGNGLGALSPQPGFTRVGSPTAVAVAALDADTIAAVVLDAGELTVAHLQNGTWNVRSIAAIMPSEPSVQLRANGTAVVSWLQLTEVLIAPGGPVGLFPVHHVAFFDAATTAISPIAMLTTESHAAPQVAWLSDTTVLASHTESRPIANVVSTDGTIVSRDDPQGALTGTIASTMDLSVLPNGDAIATWIHSGSMFASSALVVARYIGGEWQPVEAIAASPSVVPQIEALPDNRALLVWAENNPRRGVAIVLPSTVTD